ncbi:MAG: chorismate synthase [Lachnospiraceae bacterium]
MAGSTYGTIFQITTWGESHGLAMGVVIDGCPAGLELQTSDIQSYLNKRKPGNSPYASSRKESDLVEILSGVFQGCTTGAPISLLITNKDADSKAYEPFADAYRPGHADYTFDCKYGIRDYRGGGRASGRETIGRVAAGAIAVKLLSSMGITLQTFVKSIGPITIPECEYHYEEITSNHLYMPNLNYADQASQYIESCIQNGDSCGGVIECHITHLPPGLGEPVFDKLDACLAKAVLSIGGVKGFEIGDGFLSASSLGSEHNDAFCYTDNKFHKKTNHSGGVLGGISDGSKLIFRAAMKPTPSISRKQQTVTNTGEPMELSISGRHDPVLVPRGVVVVESMAAITLVDLLLLNMSARLDGLIKYYTEF